MLSMFTVFGMANVAFAQSFGTTTGVIATDNGGSPSAIYLENYRYNSDNSRYEAISNDNIYIYDNAGTYTLVNSEFASSTVYTSATFGGNYTGTNSESGNTINVSLSSWSELSDSVAAGFTNLVDTGTNFVGDQIGLILGVVITLVVFSWFIGWLIGGFRRR